MHGVSIILIVSGFCLTAAAADPQQQGPSPDAHPLDNVQPFVHAHPPADAGLHQDFYSKLERPNPPPGAHKSCCSDRDCQPVRARNSGGQWEFWDVSGWRSVPPEAMLSVKSPDNQAHACVSQITDQILCFVKPDVGI